MSNLPGKRQATGSGFSNDVAESLGIMNLRDNIAVALATDVEYRIRDIVQSASKYMKHSKRSKMTTSDIDNALRQKNIEPLYGFFPPYTGGKKRGAWFRSVPTPSNTQLFVMEDEEIDFDKILEHGPTVGVGRGVGWHAHWLAIEGIQPPVPENPVFLARKAANADDGAFSDTDEAAANLSGTTVKPLVKHVLSRELQLYYERLTSSILTPPSEAKSEENTSLPSDDTPLGDYAQISSGNLVRDAALASLRGDAGIHQLVPYLIQWVGSNVTHALRTSSQNPSAEKATSDRLNTLHQLMPSVLSILLASYFGSPSEDEVNEEALSLRIYASALLVYVIDHFSECYPTLKSRVVATLLQALLADIDDGTANDAVEASGSLDAKLGALIGLRKLGLSSFRSLLSPIGVLSGSTSEDKAKIVPLKVMGAWLEKVSQDETVSKVIYERLVQEIKAGLMTLGETSVQSSASSADELADRFGLFWVELLKDNETAQMGLSYDPHRE
ncbi:histone H4-like TAF Taf6, SAGA complex subunit [Malassezia equina]|uniref:Histone H4-like TAF Taf6, SAGA complex subunit n=1 Tax=Malassezia equina TaxID=1381935 RepID=A0AAF0EIT8_9BASI|nr:histone H4-like TAF Taf6, SAGA complex subunit [Malassezia equina]